MSTFNCRNACRAIPWRNLMQFPKHRVDVCLNLNGPSVVTLMLLLLPVVGTSQGQVSGEDLRLEWLEIQVSKSRETKKNWWRNIDADRLNTFIDAGVEVDVTDRRGWTPLHSAARYNSHPEVLITLLEAGAVVDARDNTGATPLHWAASENANVQITNSLLGADADVNARDKYGWLPIHTAAEGNSNPYVIDTLLTAGAERDKRAYFIFFRPIFLLKHNPNMSDKDKKFAIALLTEPE